MLMSRVSSLHQEPLWGDAVLMEAVHWVWHGRSYFRGESVWVSGLGRASMQRNPMVGLVVLVH